MTQIEKAKAYDEALEKAKNVLRTDLHESGVWAIKRIFPQLAESEDERMVRAIEHILYENYSDAAIIEGVEIAEIVAWLEKQKEQKPSHKFNVGDTIHCKYDDREFTIKSVDLANGVYKYTKEGCGNDIDYADENFELVEQKPAEWSEEDEKWFDYFERLLEFGYNKDPHYLGKLCIGGKMWLKSLRPSWKPSEEQMSMLLAVINDPNNAGSESCYLALKSIYEQLKKL